MRWLLVLALACGGSGKSSSGNGGSANEPAGNDCAAVRAKVEQLYRTEARAKEPSRVEEAVADNTSMVMADCAKAPAKVTACVASAGTVADLEARCLVPLDDEGTEGDRLAR